jgi:anaphase-promoting complex subunit 11
MSSRKRRSETVVIHNHSNDHSSLHSSSSTTPGGTVPSLPVPVTRLRVSIHRFHGVAQWSWNANDDVCGICQTAFEGTAPGVKYPGEDCPVVWGKCGHAFHLQCVSKWLQQPASRNSCPICRQEWEFGQNPVNSAGSSTITSTTTATTTSNNNNNSRE